MNINEKIIDGSPMTMKIMFYYFLLQVLVKP